MEQSTRAAGSQVAADWKVRAPILRLLHEHFPSDFEIWVFFGIWSLGFGISPLRVTSTTTFHSAFWFARARLKQFQLRLLDEIVVLEDADDL